MHGGSRIRIHFVEGTELSDRDGLGWSKKPELFVFFLCQYSGPDHGKRVIRTLVCPTRSLPGALGTRWDAKHVRIIHGWS